MVPTESRGFAYRRPDFGPGAQHSEAATHTAQTLRRYRLSVLNRRYRYCGHGSRLTPVRTRGAEMMGSAEIERKSTTKGKDSGMTLRGKRNETSELPASRIEPHVEDSSRNHVPTHDEIRLRAYEI